MNGQEYFESITLELTALKNRVEHFIGSAHWQTVGEWKESVLRAVLRRHLPKSIGIGKGFVITESGPSTQIDILLYDLNSPVLYQDGDLVLVTPDAVHAAIEVKTAVRPAELEPTLSKLTRIAETVRGHRLLTQAFFGLFIYESETLSARAVAMALQKVAQARRERIVHCVSIGESEFVRYFRVVPEDGINPFSGWRTYQLPKTAPAYFICNVIEALCRESVGFNTPLWFPHEGKEPYKRDDFPLVQK